MSDDRATHLLVVTKRLIMMTGAGLAVVAIPVVGTIFFKWHFWIVLSSFGCGLVGGFVSIQQRLNRLGDHELRLLSNSWFQIALIPIYGGIFALVLHIAFVGGIVEGGVFPRFFIPPFSDTPNATDVQNFLSLTCTRTGEDLAKLFFWTFLAGFSERLVPQILNASERKDP